MATSGHGGVIQQQKKSFADRLAIFSGGSSSKPSNAPLQKRNTISISGGVESRFGGLDAAKSIFQQKKKQADSGLGKRQSAFVPSAGTSFKQKKVEENTKTLQKPLPVEKIVEEQQPQLTRAKTEKVTVDTGIKLGSIRDNPFLKNDRMKASVQSKPVQKPANTSSYKKPEFLRRQQKLKDPAKQFPIKPHQPAKIIQTQSKPALPKPVMEEKQPVEIPKPATKAEDPFMMFKNKEKETIRDKPQPKKIQPDANPSFLQQEKKAPKQLVAPTGQLKNNFFLNNQNQNDQGEKRRLERQKKQKQQIQNMRKIKQVTVIGGGGTDDDQSDKDSQDDEIKSQRPRAGTTTSIEKRNTQQFNDFKANLAAKLGHMGMQRPATTTDDDDDDDTDSNDEDKSSDDDDDDDESYEQQRPKNAVPIVTVKSEEEDDDDDFQAQKNLQLQKKKGQANIFDQMQNQEQPQKKVQQDTNFLHNTEMSKPANRKSKKAAVIFDSDDDDFD